MRETEWDGSREWNHETDGCFFQGSMFCIYCGMPEEEPPHLCDEGCAMYGCSEREPEETGYYYSGTGEWSEDDSYINYLNR